MNKSLYHKLCCIERRLNVLEASQGGGSTPTLDVTQEAVYETQVLWAEENGRITSNQSEYAWGNGSASVVGLRMTDGWEITGMSFHAGTYPSTATAVVNVFNWTTASTAAANILSSISIGNAVDGGGQINNAHKVVEYTTPIPVPAGTVLGFRSGTITGVISNVRIAVFLRRKIADVITGVTLL